MNDDEIIEKILEGWSLRTFMVPDPALPTNLPEHSESYDLPHVLIGEGRFWGKTDTAHLYHTHGNPERDIIPRDPSEELLAFGYTNRGDVFCTFNPRQMKFAIIPRARYREHSWILHGNYKPVWDSAENHPAEAIEQEIRKGAKFKIAMLDAEDIWNVHPVDLPMYETEERVFRLKTAADMYPKFFRDPGYREALLTMAKEAVDEALREHADYDRVDIVPVLPVECFSSFYALCSDGTYYNFYDISRATTHEYKRLKVFSDCL